MVRLPATYVCGPKPVAVNTGGVLPVGGAVPIDSEARVVVETVAADGDDRGLRDDDSAEAVVGDDIPLPSV